MVSGLFSAKLSFCVSTDPNLEAVGVDASAREINEEAVIEEEVEESNVPAWEIP